MTSIEKSKEDARNLKDFKEINYDNAPDLLAGMGDTLCDTEIKDGCNLKTCRGCCPPMGICNKPWVI